MERHCLGSSDFGDGWITQRFVICFTWRTSGNIPSAARSASASFLPPFPQFLTISSEVGGKSLIVVSQGVKHLLQHDFHNRTFLSTPLFSVWNLLFPLDALILPHGREKRKYILHCSFHIFLIWYPTGLCRAKNRRPVNYYAKRSSEQTVYARVQEKGHRNYDAGKIKLQRNGPQIWNR